MAIGGPLLVHMHKPVRFFLPEFNIIVLLQAHSFQEIQAKCMLTQYSQTILSRMETADLTTCHMSLDAPDEVEKDLK